MIETFYRMNEELAKPETGDQALVALGEKFSKLGLEEMKKVVQQTQFYQTPEEGITLLESEGFKTTMQTVERFCVQQGLVSEPRYGFGEETRDSTAIHARVHQGLERESHDAGPSIRFPERGASGLGLGSVLLMLAAYTLLAQTRQNTVRREQQEVAAKKLVELDQRRNNSRSSIGKPRSCRTPSAGSGRRSEWSGTRPASTTS